MTFGDKGIDVIVEKEVLRQILQECPALLSGFFGDESLDAKLEKVLRNIDKIPDYLNNDDMGKLEAFLIGVAIMILTESKEKPDELRGALKRGSDLFATDMKLANEDEAKRLEFNEQFRSCAEDVFALFIE